MRGLNTSCWHGHWTNDLKNSFSVPTSAIRVLGPIKTLAGLSHVEPVILASLQDCQNNFNKRLANIALMLVTVRDLIVVSIHVESFHVQ